MAAAYPRAALGDDDSHDWYECPMQNRPEERKIEDFEIETLLGVGGCGKVYRVRDKRDDRKYALKRIDRKNLSESGAAKVAREQHILARLKSDWVLHMYWSFSDRDNTHLVLDLMTNGDLHDLLDIHYFLEEDLTAHYSAELLLGLEYLRMMNIVHRDIKSANLLVDGNMHLKITDFGLSVTLARREGIYSHYKQPMMNEGYGGTPGYIAPEVYAKERITYGQDLWAFACVIYRIYTGQHVIDNSNIYQKTLPRRTMNMQLEQLPRERRNDTLQDLLNKLLVRDPSQRLGMDEWTNKYSDLKEHQFFSNIDFHNLRNIPPPIPPAPPADFVPYFAKPAPSYSSFKTVTPLPPLDTTESTCDSAVTVVQQPGYQAGGALPIVVQDPDPRRRDPLSEDLFDYCCTCIKCSWGRCTGYNVLK